MLSVSDSYYIRMIVYVLRVARGEGGAVSFFELLRVSHILSGLEEHCVPCCGGSRNEAVAVEIRCAELWQFEELGKLSGAACDCYGGRGPARAEMVQCGGRVNNMSHQ